MLARIPTSVRITVVAVVLVMGAGVATYFLGRGPDEDVQTPVQTNVDLAVPAGASGVSAEEVLRLPWGTGPAEASRKGTPTRKSTIEAVFGSEGHTFIVDHPEGVYGARVRWFSRDGQLAGSTLAPPGSKMFGPRPGGFDYVIAKSAVRSETAVLFDVETSTETTYVIPLGMNTGGLTESGGTVYASVAPSELDFESERISLRYALIPVAVEGQQVDDAASDQGAIDVWGFGLDGEAYTFTMEAQGINIDMSEVISTVGWPGGTMRIPRGYRLLGVTRDSKIVLQAMPPSATKRRPRQLSPIWIAAEEPFTDVLVVDREAKLKASITVPYPVVLARYDRSVPMSLSEDGMYTLRADEGGVSVVVHRF